MSGLLSVDEALRRILNGVEPTDIETVPLADVSDRTLARDVISQRTQPPFAASAMDGYAVRFDDVKTLPANLRLIGESAAGHGFSGAVESGETVRIFTGAPVPEGADTIVIQEDTKAEGDTITVLEVGKRAAYVRPAGLDFLQGDVGLNAGRILDPAAQSLAASMNYASLKLRRQPRVAIISSGDELLPPGSELGADQIISSNSFGVAGIVRRAGGLPVDLGIAADSLEALAEKFDAAADADIIVTLGGASVGDHDLVQEALKARGAQLNFWKLAMKPGKPVMFGQSTHDGRLLRYIGLPGNPVSSLVCARIFVEPLIRKMLGQTEFSPQIHARLATDLPPSGPRQEYMRAKWELRDGTYFVTPFDNQDSSILSLLAKADCLLIRPANAVAAIAGDNCFVMDA